MPSLAPSTTSGLGACGARLRRPAGCPRPLALRTSERIAGRQLCQENQYCNSWRLAAAQEERSRAQTTSPSANAALDTAKRYNVMLTLVARFLALPDKQPLHAFLRAKPEVISVPFISWVADQEATAVGEQKRVLAGICEELVIFRERLDDERMELLYADTLTALTDGEADKGAAALALAASPDQYATKLAEVVTGKPMVTEGFDPVYDVLLKVVPVAALTPEGVKRGHAMAKDLGTDLRARRKRSVQSMIGRAQLTPEQADKLMAGSNATRILDMLLGMASTADRLDCLPDCFTPPPLPPASEEEAQTYAEDNPEDSATATATAAAPPTSSSPSPSRSTPSPTSDSEDLIWCTPSQLLVELDSRLQRLEGRGPRPPPGEAAGPAAPLLAPPGAHFLTGEALLAELRLLRDEVRRTWLDSIEVKDADKQSG